MPTPSKTSRAIAAQFAMIALAFGCLLAASRIYPLEYLVRWLRENVARYEPWSMLVYPLVHASCNLLLLPGGMLVVGCGFFFGLWRGFLLALTGHLLGAAAAFWISRTVGRGLIERHLASRPQWRALDLVVAREGWKIVLLSQLSPLFPTSLFNYCYGLTRLRFWPCMLCIAVGWSPGMFVYCYVGRMGSVGWRIMHQGTGPTTAQYVVWLGGLVLSIGVTAALGSLAVRLLREARARAVAEPESGEAGPDLGEPAKAARMELASARMAGRRSPR
jgi:uncharacterized membrane protein YdjX (TVP38/TMEM64 family)